MGQWLKERVVLGIISALVVAWTVTSPIDLAFGADSCSTDIPSNATTLSACLGDNFPVGKDVTIGPTGGTKCARVKVDGSRTGTNALGKITIEQWGYLYFPDQTVELETKGIDVSGLLQVGTATCPIGTTHSTNKVTITFTGARPTSEDHTKGIVVQKAGRLLLYGARGVPGGTPDGVSWTHLSEAAGPDRYAVTKDGIATNVLRPVPGNGATTLQLAKDVATGAGAWQDGDWIAVATTSFSPFETEFVQINAPVSKGAAGSTVTLKSPQALQFYHFGGPDPGPPGPDNFILPKATKNDKDHNYGVDERAEVGLISRNIKLTAKIESDDANKHWGGEIRILNGFKDIDIQGVEIEKFGKDQLGSYPIHLHMAGDLTNTPPLINANSVHHSYNKCVTIHSTQKVTIQNMVCARIVGHIFYQEIGDEAGVKFQNNLGLGAMSHNFDVNAWDRVNKKFDDTKRQTMIEKFYWIGDNLAKTADFGYDGFRVLNTDATDNPTHGKCSEFDTLGQIAPGGPGPYCADPKDGNKCAPGERRICRGDPPPPATATLQTYYTEPASGFWIIDPGTELVGNSIGGCQGEGRAYWYVPPTASVNGIDLKFEPVGKNQNNRAHSCFAGLYGEPENFVVAEQLFPHKHIADVKPPDAPPLIATFDQFTATRNRGRGIWVRPVWFAVTNARLATNRLNVTIVTSGGLEGNAPGVWGLLKDSVIVGVSTNNVDRFGPCPTEQDPNRQGDLKNGVGGKFGCIDITPGPQFVVDPASRSDIRGGGELGTNSGGGYPVPEWNFFGYYIYDGPVRIFDNRFVNFLKDPRSLWTTADQEFFKTFADLHRFNIPDKIPIESHEFIYEGDAALGWFDSNQSAYPTSTVGRGFHWTNVDLRHQIFTENVNRADFNDGDKNTAIIDLDGTLTGFRVATHDQKEVKGQEPISLNNLPFNASSNSVDECLTEGAKDEFFEGRPTSLISPGSMATLEFGALYPDNPSPPSPGDSLHPCNNTKTDIPCKHTQVLTFSKDSQDFGQHQTMALHSRDGQGLWEPKVTSGFGYTVTACASKNPNLPTDTTCDDSKNSPHTGIPNYVSVGLTDAVKPGIDPSDPETWFSVRLGICYTDKDGKFPSDASKFSITRGYKSYAGGNVQFKDAQLQKYFNQLENRLPNEICNQLDRQTPNNTCPDGPGCSNSNVIGCPARGVTLPNKLVEGKADCKDQPGSDPGTDASGKQPVCIHDKKPLTRAGSINDLKGPERDKKYFYDPTTGMLYFNVIQDLPNPHGPSPLGSCSDPPNKATDDPSCPDVGNGESYYACPAAGCPHYVVKLLNSDNQLDTAYQPGRSRLADGTTTCKPYPTYAQNEPAKQNVLVLVGDTTNTPIVTKEELGKDNKFPHHAPNAAQDTPICPVNPLTIEEE